MGNHEFRVKEYLDIARYHNFEVGTYVLQEAIYDLKEDIREADNEYAADCSYEEKAAAEDALWEFTRDGGASWMREYLAA